MDQDTAKAIAVSTFEHVQASLLANEELGERRVQAYLTVLGAGGVVVGLVADGPGAGDPRLLPLLATTAAVALVVGLVGASTALRLAKRDCATTEMATVLAGVRARAGDALGTPLPWSGGPPQRSWRWLGLTAQLVVVNSAVLALGLGALVGLLDPLAGLLVGVGAVLPVGWLHRRAVVAVYAEQARSGRRDRLGGAPDPLHPVDDQVQRRRSLRVSRRRAGSG